jgi:hypothetical protein
MHGLLGSRHFVHALAALVLTACGTETNDPEFSTSGFTSNDPSTSTGDGGSATTSSSTGDSQGGDGDGDSTTSGDGDGPTSGDGDGTTTGDGDGTTTTGDGDGTTTTGDGDGTTTGDGDGTTTTGDGDGTTTTGDGDGTTTGDGDGTTTGDGDGDIGCHGVDFLFVIDNSGSMSAEQAALIASFDDIMVTDTDAASIEPDPACTFQCALTPGGSCGGVPCSLQGPLCLAICSMDPTAMCGGGNCSDLAGCGNDPCECALGAGIVSDTGGTACGVAGGSLYMQDGQPDLTGTFSCVADVGTGGSGSELQIESMLQALGPLNDVGGCNEGFQRDDSILVVTVITDEEDTNSNGDPASWRTDLLAVKNNDEAGIVVLGLVGDTGETNAVCDMPSNNTGADPSPRLRSFVSSFQNNVLGSVCEADYNSFFQQAVDLIEETCMDFPVPQ